jgi:hypothetical protein
MLLIHFYYTWYINIILFFSVFKLCISHMLNHRFNSLSHLSISGFLNSCHLYRIPIINYWLFILFLWLLWFWSLRTWRCLSWPLYLLGKRWPLFLSHRLCRFTCLWKCWEDFFVVFFSYLNLFFFLLFKLRIFIWIFCKIQFDWNFLTMNVHIMRRKLSAAFKNKEPASITWFIANKVLFSLMLS